MSGQPGHYDNFFNSLMDGVDSSSDEEDDDIPQKRGSSPPKEQPASVINWGQSVEITQDIKEEKPVQIEDTPPMIIEDLKPIKSIVEPEDKKEEKAPSTTNTSQLFTQSPVQPKPPWKPANPVARKRPVINRGKHTVLPSSLFDGPPASKPEPSHQNLSPEEPQSLEKEEENRRDSGNFETIQIEQEKPQVEGKIKIKSIEKPKPPKGLFESISSYLMNVDEDEAKEEGKEQEELQPEAPEKVEDPQEKIEELVQEPQPIETTPENIGNKEEEINEEEEPEEILGEDDEEEDDHPITPVETYKVEQVETSQRENIGAALEFSNEETHNILDINQNNAVNVADMDAINEMMDFAPQNTGGSFGASPFSIQSKIQGLSKYVEPELEVKKEGKEPILFLEPIEVVQPKEEVQDLKPEPEIPKEETKEEKQEEPQQETFKISKLGLEINRNIEEQSLKW